MKLAANVAGLDQLAADLKKLGAAFAVPAAEAATDALASTLDQAREGQGIATPLIQSSEGTRRTLAATDPESVARELGSLTLDATPWLAPSLPAAQGPMRAAAASAVARAISVFRFKR